MIEWFVQNRKNIVKCISRVRKSFSFIILLLVVCSTVAVLMPTFNMKLVNLYVYENFSVRHVIWFLLYVGAIMAMAFLEYGSRITRKKIENSIQAYINELVIEDAVNKKITNYSDEESANIDVLIKSDGPLYQQFICICLLDYPFMTLKAIAVLSILLWLKPTVALTVLGLEILVTVLQRQLCKSVEKQSNVVRNSLVGYFGVINDIASNISMIESTGADDYLKEKSLIKFHKYAEENVKQTRYSARASLIIEMLLSLNVLVVLGIGSYGIYNGIMTVGALLSLVQYVGLFVSIFTSLCESTVMLRSVKGKVACISDIISKHVIVEKMAKPDFQFDTLQISDLDFSYSQEKIIFKHASAMFSKGDLNCICGASGSGKTTLIKLMLGEYVPESDECLRLLFNGKRMGRLEANMIAYVPQQNVFFSDTIFQNIVLGSTVITEDVYRICRECAIYDEIEALENGFDSIVSSSIHNLSGGQLKRLSVVRAILQNREILLLDEPTAGLDAENAAKVLSCITKYAGEKLVIVITHDKYIEKHADVIYRLENQKLRKDIKCLRG